MAQIFSRASNTIAPLIVYGAVFALLAVLYVWYLSVYSFYNTEVGVERQQPVQFSHEHHVSGLGIDCRYCHTSVEKSAFAGIPSTEICMNCHSQIWRDSPMLEPVRASYRTGQPLRWRRVNRVPDFVFFNHSAHIAGGIGCESCHGAVDRMPLMYKAHTLYMNWCLDCHEHPQTYVRPANEIYRFRVPQLSESEREELMQQYGLPKRNLSDCYTCHR